MIGKVRAADSRAEEAEGRYREADRTTKVLKGELTELITDCTWLHTELSRTREQTISNGKPFHFIIDGVEQKGTYHMDSNIVDDRTPGEKRLGEIESKLKKYHV